MSLRRFGSVGAALLAFALIGGAATAVVRAHRHSGVSSHFAAETTTYPQQSLPDAIRDTLAGLDADEFVDVRLEQQASADGTPLTSVAPGMLIDIKAPAEDHGASIPAQWEAMVAEGAIADRIAGDAPALQDVVGNLDVTLTLPDGTTDDVGGGTGYVTSGEVFGAQASGVGDSEIEQHVDTVLASYGLRSDRVRVLHPLGPAVWVVASTDDSSRIRGRFDELQNALLGTAPDFSYEGLYLEIDNAKGEPLIRVGNALRNGGGVSWTSSTLRGAGSP
jgi:hypothetical protein